MNVFGEIIGMLMTLVVYSAYIFLIAFTLWMAVDAGKQDRFWWMVLIIGIPFVGSGVYFFTEKKHEYAKAESHHIHDGETEAQHETSPHKRKARRVKTSHVEKPVEQVSEVTPEVESVAEHIEQNPEVESHEEVVAQEVREETKEEANTPVENKEENPV